MNIIEIRDNVFLLNTLHTSYLYFLRRNLATKLYIHDLTIDECQYYMGHEIDSRRVLRSDFSDEDMLYSIYKKLLNDPLSDNCTLQKIDEN